tara:strand:+ start:432 stop:638 length:207 start_codon:yes stop_codon:yes gene_type:complete
MDQASKYTLGLLARVPRQQLLNNKEYIIEQFGEKTWNILFKLNASYHNKFVHGVGHTLSSFTLDTPRE